MGSWRQGASPGDVPFLTSTSFGFQAFPFLVTWVVDLGLAFQVSAHPEDIVGTCRAVASSCGCLGYDGGRGKQLNQEENILEVNLVDPFLLEALDLVEMAPLQHYSHGRLWLLNCVHMCPFFQEKRSTNPRRRTTTSEEILEILLMKCSFPIQSPARMCVQPFQLQHEANIHTRTLPAFPWLGHLKEHCLIFLCHT
uniref:Uncharacterized protein LOC100176471 n=1 Tax=Phallusia mammillata TaxID=59560 RepID=A0A6F9DFS3_9ASCI|nr:uncharacterized protein LOC100176471 [Phallusia mammillata]